MGGMIDPLCSRSSQDQQWEYDDLQQPAATSAAQHVYNQSVLPQTKSWSGEQDPLPQGPGGLSGGGSSLGGEPALRGIFGSPTKLTPVWADQRPPQQQQAPNSPPQQQPSVTTRLAFETKFELSLF